MKNATLPEYLQRMALHIALFATDIRFEGITVSDKPSMMIGRPAGEPSEGIFIVRKKPSIKINCIVATLKVLGHNAYFQNGGKEFGSCSVNLSL